MREYDLSGAHWHKSSYSDQHGGDCVEVANNVPGIVPVRDSKFSGDGSPVLMIPARSWTGFIEAVKG
ncbi:DUF397 domain-containing protein [Streptomyces cavernicola]|uniref:DUF397 domain-containing protein n=1 Tax=Streptomyces cavernicola TaxID=3043613 RepID=A0ABT6SDS0_9ACTN|nr:DUF397 domain-containing protein [Streptomyces sp. B-S-A6]MDI3406340.1 DUF397 domain-containing protein [Streptomyces sp. B-S-A6]